MMYRRKNATLALRKIDGESHAEKQKLQLVQQEKMGNWISNGMASRATNYAALASACYWGD